MEYVPGHVPRRTLAFLTTATSPMFLGVVSTKRRSSSAICPVTLSANGAILRGMHGRGFEPARASDGSLAGRCIGDHNPLPDTADRERHGGHASPNTEQEGSPASREGPAQVRTEGHRCRFQTRLATPPEAEQIDCALAPRGESRVDGRRTRLVSCWCSLLQVALILRAHRRRVGAEGHVLPRLYLPLHRLPVPLLRQRPSERAGISRDRPQPRRLFRALLGARALAWNALAEARGSGVMWNSAPPGCDHRGARR